LVEKLPKLEDARTTLGVDRTMLVLENADYQLTDPWEVGVWMRDAIERDALPAPDVVVLVGIGPTSAVI
jgi:hypothetical protein